MDSFDLVPEDQLEYFRQISTLVTSGKLQEAEIPVPITLFQNRQKAKNIVIRMKLSQKIGFLLFLHRSEIITEAGLQNLNFLQQKASLEAVVAGVRFCERLALDEKLLSDFWRSIEILNFRFKSPRFRKFEARRIGIGYRDKGNLPSESSRGIKKADEEALVFLSDISPVLAQKVIELFPACLTDDGEWLDLSHLIRISSDLREENIRLLLSSM